jgi:DNA-binding GntR family transcriptional regulator
MEGPHTRFPPFKGNPLPIVDIIEDNLADSKLRPQSAGKDPYHLLREAIVSGKFHPNERLVEATVATTIGAGRTAVRAALVRLDQEGLVSLEPNRGARVRLISDREALEIEEVRATLEALLARRAATAATATDLRDLRNLIVLMRERVAEGDSIGYSELNPLFHQRIWAAADHPTASRLVGSLKSQSIRFQFQTILRPGRTERSLHEHEAIFSALKERNPDAAEQAMRDHLGEVLDTLRWAIKGQRPATGWLPG